MGRTGLSGSARMASLALVFLVASDLDRRVDGVAVLRVAAADEGVAVLQVGPVDDQRSAWLQVVAAAHLVLR